MSFEKVEKRRIITFYFKTSKVDVGECRAAPAALVKIAQQSGISTEKVAFHNPIFCQGVLSFISFANEITNF